MRQDGKPEDELIAGLVDVDPKPTCSLKPAVCASGCVLGIRIAKSDGGM
jgi:hypothetical protein